MNINIKATNIELTNAIKDYTNSKIESLQKFLPKDKVVDAFVEIGKVSNHHRNGEDVFMAEIKMIINGKEFFAQNYNDDLYKAVDFVRDEALREIKNNKEKNQTLFIRGARKLKKRIKGMKPWWPFGGSGEGK